MTTRRKLLRTLPLVSLPLGFAPLARALPPAHIVFPRDHGAHPDLRTEWWYMTGHLTSGSRDFGFQVTFFRTRVDGTQAMRSRFAAKQLIFAHAAITDVDGKVLLHDQRIAREGFDVAVAAQDDLRLRLRDWSFKRATNGDYVAHVAGNGFRFDLRCAPTEDVLLQGDHGLSRKGPRPDEASYYYSVPQLSVTGSIGAQGRKFDVKGKAWLDHEWSEEILDPAAVGWDWIGMNLDDGSALTAFRLRKPDGSTLWDGGSFRPRGGSTYVFSQGEVLFNARRRWTSPLTKAAYPVEWLVRTPADFYTVTAVLDNQELDSRASTGAVYWEGLARLVDSNGRHVGMGYLEMTGYAERLRI